MNRLCMSRWQCQLVCIIAALIQERRFECMFLCMCTVQYLGVMGARSGSFVHHQFLCLRTGIRCAQYLGIMRVRCLLIHSILVCSAPQSGPPRPLLLLLLCSDLAQRLECSSSDFWPADRVRPCRMPAATVSGG